MTPADLEVLVRQGEGTTLGFKESLPSSFAREVVALAHTVGGRIRTPAGSEHRKRTGDVR